MTMAEQIERKLTEALSPETIAVVDESEAHRGHAGYREGGESHFAVDIVSNAFEGLSRIARQRAVYAVLGDEMKGRIHALRMRTHTPAERLKCENG